MQTKENVIKVIHHELRTISNKVKDMDEAALNASLFDELNMDSLDILEIVMTLEEHFSIEVSDKLLDTFDTLTVEKFGEFIHLTIQNTTVK